MKISQMITLGVVMGLVALTGCASKMATLNSEMPLPVDMQTGKYTLESIVTADSGIDASKLRDNLFARHDLRMVFSGKGEEKYSLPVSIHVTSVKTNVNGGIAGLNNLIAALTLSVWPMVSSVETKYKIEVSSIIGTNVTDVAILERDWQGISPLAMIPVPGRADKRGSDGDIKAYHFAQVVTGVHAACSGLPKDYKAFVQDHAKYLEKIDQIRSRTAFDKFRAATETNEQMSALMKIRNRAAICSLQSEFVEALKATDSPEIRRTLLKLLDNACIPNFSAKEQRILAGIYRDGYHTLGESDRQAILDKLVDEKILTEMVIPPSELEVRNSQVKLREKRSELEKRIRYAEHRVQTCIEAAERYERNRRFDLAKKERIETERLKLEIQRFTNELVILENIRAEDEFLYIGDRKHGLSEAPFDVAKHATLVKKLSDDCIKKLLASRNPVYCRDIAFTFNSPFTFNRVADRLFLMNRFSEEERVELALADIKRHSVHQWNRGDIVALETGVGVAANVKDRKAVMRILMAVLMRMERYRQEGDKEFSWWGRSDENRVKIILARFPRLSETEIGAIICLNPLTWRYLIDQVSANCAYMILIHGKENPEELEMALIKKLPASRIDMKVVSRIRSDTGKKAIMAVMPEEVKKVVRESEEEAFAAVMKKAKTAARQTFELHGFYLGMSVADAKTVFKHHFPDGEVRLSKDGDALYVSGQGAPLCRLSKDAKSVCQFNFGKRILQKWYRFNAARTSSWAHAYARAHGIEMELEFLDEDDEIILPVLTLFGGDDVDTSYNVSLHQETYQYKNGLKNYRLTYFGIPKISAFGGGPVAKAMAEDLYSKISAAEGTLRAEIEKD